VSLGLGEEQVDVVWHDDVAEEKELVALADSFEGFFEEDAGGVVVEIGEMAIAAEVDGVVVALGLVALETTWRELMVAEGMRTPPMRKKRA
jgi:hypothetical protein